MRGLLCALIVLLCLVSQAFCAAGTTGQSFYERISLSDLDAHWGWDTYVTGEEFTLAGNAWVTVEVPYDLSYSSLVFAVNGDDTSLWDAYFNFSGEKSLVDSFSGTTSRPKN